MQITSAVCQYNSQ